jgi:hypothetical protein
MNVAAPALATPKKSTAPYQLAGQQSNALGTNSLIDSLEQTTHCACGGDCPRCNRKKKNNKEILQAKLKVGDSDNAYEQEANRVADEVMASPGRIVVSNNSARRIQGLKSQASEHRSTAPPSVERALSGSGRSIDTYLQQDLSQRFGQDFSKVRIHTDVIAEQSAKDLGACAYTVGHNIVFGAGQFAPATPQGKHLLAHELTHVVQQSENRNLGIQRYIAEDVLTTHITREQADEMTDAELDQEMHRLRNHLSTLDRTSSDFAGAVENLHILESIALSRMPAITHNRPRPRTAPAGTLLTTTTERPSFAVTALSSTELMAEASRMTPDELSDEITRLRSLMTGVSDDSFENLANRERLNVFESELSGRNASILEHADSVYGARERFDFDIGNVFVSGFAAGALREIPPGEVYDFFHRDLRENPILFTRGCEEGVGLGFIDGANNLLEIPRSIFEVFERAVMYATQNEDALDQLGDDAVHELAYQILGERFYTKVAVDTSYLERRRAYERQANLITAAIRSFSEELAADPTIVLQWSSDLGLALGQSIGQSVTEDFLRASPRQQGVIVGRIIGQTLFEIILQLVLAVATEGVGNAIRASTGAAHGVRAAAELTAMLREMVEASPAVRRLLRLVRLGGTRAEELADTAVDLTRIADSATDLASARQAESLDALLHTDDTHIPVTRAAESSESTVSTPTPESSPSIESPIRTETPSSDLTATLEPETAPIITHERPTTRRHATPELEATTVEDLEVITTEELIISEDIDVSDRAIAGEQPHEQLEILGEEDIADMRVTDRDRGVGGHDPDSTASREALREAAGPRPTDAPRSWEGHHIIPWELREHPAVYEYERLIAGVDNPRATVAGRAINTEDNAVYLPSSSAVTEGEGMTIHRGSHPHYTSWVESRLDQLWAEYYYGDIELEEFGRRFEGLIGEFESRLISGEIGRVRPGGRRVLR